MDNIFAYWRNKRICITGGAGFIGHHVTQGFLQHGAQVTIYDDFSTGDLARIHALSDQYSNLRIVPGCITRMRAWAHRTAAAFDHIVHLAAVASVTHATHHPDHCFQTNLDGTYEVLRTARDVGASVSFASSAAVYGPQKALCQEGMTPQPQSWYARSKLMGELLCQQAATENVPTLSFRYFNVVGAGQAWQGPSAGVASIWRHHITHRQPITIHGDGNQVRDFVDVERLVHAHLLLPQLPVEEQRGQPINICTGKATSLKELIMLLAQQQGLPEYPIQFAPARPGDITWSVGDCSRYQNIVHLLEQ